MDEIISVMSLVLGSKLTDDQAMNLALQEAEKGWGWVSPNPAVGCVVLDQHQRLIGYGHHERYGGPHAEAKALQGLTPTQLQGARVFVTLEPCSHYGKTPPCAEMLAQLPIKEVIYGLQDPNPQVQGQGLAILQQAGITVTPYQKNLEHFEKVCEHFLKNMRHKQPFITLKAAMSLDGKIALKNGQSQWITGEESRLEAHRLRAYHDAILVGVNTFLTDNPSLNIRHPQFKDKENKVIVLDPRGRGIKNLKKSRLYASHKPEQIYWVLSEDQRRSALNSLTPSSTAFTSDEALKTLKDLGVHIIDIPAVKIPRVMESGGRGVFSQELDLTELLKKLWEHSIKSMMVEGGAATMSSFINQQKADRLALFIAPILIGAVSGLDWLSELHPIETLSQSVKLSNFNTVSLGKDVLLSVSVTSDQ